jgi:signal transduction histidine kinase
MAMCEFLQNGSLVNDQLDYVSSIKTASELMHQLVNDVLDLGQLQAGKMKVSLETVNLRNYIETIQRMYQSSITGAGLLFLTEIDSNLPKYVVIDPKRVMQILCNLLSNARKVHTQTHTQTHTLPWSQTHTLFILPCIVYENGVNQVVGESHQCRWW